MDPEEAAKALSVERECGVEAKTPEAARENGPPKSISDIPLAWVKDEDRKALCEQLFTQGSNLRKRGQGTPGVGCA